MPDFTLHPSPIPGLGATITDLPSDLTTLSAKTFTQLRDALYTHSVLCIKSQSHLTPAAQAALTRRFDPAAGSYGHGRTIDSKRSILHPDLKTCPAQPEVQIIGNGYVEEYEGLKDFRLKHPHHRTFHKTVIPEEEDLEFTRFYRWHIDAALFGDLNPPMVTSLLAVKVPRGRRQVVRYDDGSGEELEVGLGTTAFVSGRQMFARLSEEEREFVRGAKVEYAPHPYVWISGARSRSDGLGMASEGREVAEEELPGWDKDGDVQVLPMVWRNEVTGEEALQVHPSVVRRVHCGDGRVLELEEAREVVYRLQRPGIRPEMVYAHDWEEGVWCCLIIGGCCIAWWVRLRRMRSGCSDSVIWRPVCPSWDLRLWLGLHDRIAVVVLEN